MQSPKNGLKPPPEKRLTREQQYKAVTAEGVRAGIGVIVSVAAAVGHDQGILASYISLQCMAMPTGTTRHLSRRWVVQTIANDEYRIFSLGTLIDCLVVVTGKFPANLTQKPRPTQS